MSSTTFTVPRWATGAAVLNLAVAVPAAYVPASPQPNDQVLGFSFHVSCPATGFSKGLKAYLYGTFDGGATFQDASTYYMAIGDPATAVAGWPYAPVDLAGQAGQQ